jgi:hypothetical protein
MTLKIFEYIERAFNSIFYRNKREIYPKEFIRRISEKSLSEGTLNFSTPEYLENGVYLSIKDRNGLMDYIKNRNSKNNLKERINLEEKVSLEEPKYSKKEENEQQSNKKFPFEYGFEKTREFLKENYLKSKNIYDSISLKFSEKYSGWKYFSSGNELNFIFGKT